MGGLGLPANLAAGVWLLYGGAKLWQTLKNGKGDGITFLREALRQLADSTRETHELIRETNKLVAGHDQWERARAELQDRHRQGER